MSPEFPHHALSVDTFKLSVDAMSLVSSAMQHWSSQADLRSSPLVESQMPEGFGGAGAQLGAKYNREDYDKYVRNTPDKTPKNPNLAVGP